MRRSANAPADAAGATGTVFGPRVATESKFPDGTTEATVGGADFRSSSKRSASGDSNHTFAGTPVRGERDVLQACENLQEALKRDGIVLTGKFVQPGGAERGVDAVAMTTTGEAIEVQTVGVLDQATLATLGRAGAASTDRDAAARADDICAAVQKKSASYAGQDKQEITLMLDSIRSPGHVSGEVLQELQSPARQAVLKGAGLKAIWLVGPTSDRTHKLHG
jgi:hypothetical protein